MKERTYYFFVIGRKWANQYGKGVATRNLTSLHNPPKRLPKGYTMRAILGFAKR